MSAPHVDYASRSPGGLAAIFRQFGTVEAPGLNSPLYEHLSLAVAGDRDLLAIASLAPPGQPPPNMLYAAVQYLLLSGVDHPLRGYYPALASGPAPPGPAFPHFRDLCLTYRDEIERLIATRRVQTNVIQRCVCLLPAFTMVHRESGGLPLALVEVGASAGLNLNWDRFGYDYRRHGVSWRGWGDPLSPIQLDTELRGPLTPPLPAAGVPVASRTGVDIHPVDIAREDQVRWLRALIWPEHVARHRQLHDAIAIARAHPYRLHRGDAVDVLPRLMADAPAGAALTVFATVVLYQFTEDARRALFDVLACHAPGRPLWFVTLDTSTTGPAELRLRTFEGGRCVSERLLALCNPHGHWMELLAELA